MGSFNSEASAMVHGFASQSEGVHSTQIPSRWGQSLQSKEHPLSADGFLAKAIAHKCAFLFHRQRSYASIVIVNEKAVQRTGLLWRKRWDSNPCDLAVNRISSAARYDHFDTFPFVLLHYNTLLIILQLIN